MQKLMTAAVLMAGLFLFSSLQAQETDSLSYSIGVLLAKNLKSQGFDKIDYASFESAVKDVFADGELMIDPQQAQMTVQTFMMKKQQMQGEKNKEAGEAFLEENAQREEVTVLPSGLQYEVLEQGDGAGEPDAVIGGPSFRPRSIFNAGGGGGQTLALF